MNTGFFNFFIFLIILSGCASQSPLSGGERDNIPPELIYASPPQYATNINPKKLEFVFNEFIQIRSLQQKLLVSPPLKYTPQIKQKPKSFYLIINDTLLENTTYQFYFADAIVDLTEGNPLLGFTYVFSTGKNIDSLTISGKILDAFTNKPEPLFSVCLYSDTTDSVVFKNNPNFICKSDNNGLFKLKYIKEGKYKLVAFNDKNNNYRFDPASEKIAFLSSCILLQENLDSIILYSFQENRIKQYIKKTERKKPYYALILFNQPSNYKPKITFSSASILQTIFSNENDTLEIFFADSLQYSKDTINLQIQYMRYDSLLQEHFITENKSLIIEQIRSKVVSTSKSSYKVSVSNNQTISAKEKLYITFSQPVNIDTQNVKLLIYVKDTIYEKIPASLSMSEQNPLKYFIDTKLLDGKKYRLILNFQSLLSYYGQFFDSDTIDFKTFEQEDYGSLNVNYIVPDDSRISFLYELIDEKNKTIYKWVDSLSNIKKIDYILPGKYTLRCIEDKNSNKRWESGFYLLKQQPEKVFIYPQTIQVRSNWDLEIKWEIKN